MVNLSSVVGGSFLLLLTLSAPSGVHGAPIDRRAIAEGAGGLAKRGMYGSDCPLSLENVTKRPSLPVQAGSPGQRAPNNTITSTRLQDINAYTMNMECTFPGRPGLRNNMNGMFTWLLNKAINYPTDSSELDPPGFAIKINFTHGYSNTMAAPVVEAALLHSIRELEQSFISQNGQPPAHIPDEILEKTWRQVVWGGLGEDYGASFRIRPGSDRNPPQPFTYGDILYLLQRSLLPGLRAAANANGNDGHLYKAKIKIYAKDAQDQVREKPIASASIQRVKKVKTTLWQTMLNSPSVGSFVNTSYIRSGGHDSIW